MHLEADGTLSPSTGRPFTHILKPAGTGGYDSLPLIEWLSMTLGRDAGLAAPATALVAMPDDLPPALIVERFDIRESLDDTRMLALEDFLLRARPSVEFALDRPSQPGVSLAFLTG